MATAGEVLAMLIPDGGWIVTGNDYEGIEFLSCDPITEQEFLDGFAKVDKFKAEQVITQETAKAAILEKLGITAEEAILLLS